VVHSEGIVVADEFEAACFFERAIRRQAHAFPFAGEHAQECADIIQRTAASGTFAARTDRTLAGCHGRTVDRQLAKNMACESFIAAFSLAESRKRLCASRRQS